MLEELQQFVDDLAEDLDRGVVIEDERHSLMVYSPQRQPMDRVRERSIFLRETPREAIEWVERAGVRTAVGPLRVDAAPEIGAESRLCVPVRARGSVLGYIVVLDPGQTLDAAQVAHCAEAGAMLSPLLREVRQTQQDRFAYARDLVDTLLSEGAANADGRERARVALAREGRLRAGEVAVVAIEPRWRAGRRDASDDEALLVQLVGRVRRACPAAAMVATTRADHAICLMSLEAPGQRDPRAAATRAQRALEPLVLSSALRAPAVVAYGPAAPAADKVPLSYRRARQALQVAHALADVREAVVGWEQLGVYQLLAQVPADELGRTSGDEQVRRLLDKPELATTLELYLDLAGDAKRTAEQLSLHRASLYYRLRRIEELAEIDLKSGADRLAAHLSLKALRLAGELT